MITENLSTLKIHKLTKKQYEREFNAGRIDETALYLTPDEGNDSLTNKVSGNIITITDISPVEHTLKIEASSKNKITSIAYHSNATVADGVITQINADTRTNILYKIVTTTNGVIGVPATLTANDIGRHSISFTVEEGLTQLVFGVGGTQRDTTVLLNTLPAGTYTISWETTNATQGSISWKDMQIEEGTTATPYTPHIADVSTANVQRYGKNLIPYPFYSTSATRDGVTFTDNGDGSIALKGTATKDISYCLMYQNAFFGSGYINAINAEQATNLEYSANKRLYYDSAQHNLFIIIGSGVTVDEVLYPQVEMGSKFTEYEPPVEVATYPINADGSVDNVTSLYPMTTLIPDAGVILEVEYYQNIGLDYVLDNCVAKKDYLQDKINLGSLDNVISLPLDVLQVLYDFKYYTSLETAISDINADTIGANADATKDTASAGVYTTSDSKVVAVLMQNVTLINTVQITSNMILNLCGNTITFESGARLDILATVTDGIIDGRASGSTIRKKLTEASTQALEVILNLKGKCKILGGCYDLDIVSATMAGCTVMTTATSEVEFEGCTIKAKAKDCMVYGFQNKGNITFKNCDITASTMGGDGYGIVNYKSATLTECRLFADGICGGHEDYWFTAVDHLDSAENLTLVDCDVFGVSTGLQLHNSATIIGGTYKGVGHGGIYFGNANKRVDVQNAKITCVRYPGEYKLNFDYDAQYCVAGFYVGGNSNIEVYMDNCEIVGGDVNSFVLRGTDDEQNNKVYMSNCTVIGDKIIRIDNDTLKLYLGKHNNITAENTNRPASVVTTTGVFIPGLSYNEIEK